MAHMHYTGTGKMHSFRGLLIDGGQDKIRIQGSVGAIAWRITKFEIIPQNPGTELNESVVQVFREEQSSPTAVVDFNNDELLAAAYLAYNYQAYYGMDKITIFDNALFVRNIWITHVETSGAANCNYYIELEEVKVSAAGMAQLAVVAARRTL